MKTQKTIFLTLLIVLTANFTLTSNPIMSKSKMIVKIKSQTQSIDVQIANLQKQRILLNCFPILKFIYILHL